MIYKVLLTIKGLRLNVNNSSYTASQKAGVQYQLFVKFVIKITQNEQQKHYPIYGDLKGQNKQMMYLSKFTQQKSNFHNVRYQFYIKPQNLNQQNSNTSFQIHAYLSRFKYQNQRTIIAQKNNKKIGFLQVEVDKMNPNQKTYRQDSFLKCKDKNSQLDYQVICTIQQFNHLQIKKFIIGDNLNLGAKRQKQQNQQSQYQKRSQFLQNQIQKQYATQEYHQQTDQLASVEHYQQFLNMQIDKLKLQQLKLLDYSKQKQQLIQINLKFLDEKLTKKQKGCAQNQEKYQQVKQKIGQIMNIINQNSNINLVSKVQSMIMASNQELQ